MSRWQGRLNFKVLCSCQMSIVGSDSLTKFGNHKASQRDIPSSDKILIFVQQLCTHAANYHYITGIKLRQVKRASDQLCLASDWSSVINAGLWLADEASTWSPYGRVVYWLTCQVWPLITCNTDSVLCWHNTWDLTLTRALSADYTGSRAGTLIVLCYWHWKSECVSYVYLSLLSISIWAHIIFCFWKTIQLWLCLKTFFVIVPTWLLLNTRGHSFPVTPSIRQWSQSGLRCLSPPVSSVCSGVMSRALSSGDKQAAAGHLIDFSGGCKVSTNHVSSQLRDQNQMKTWLSFLIASESLFVIWSWTTVKETIVKLELVLCFSRFVYELWNLPSTDCSLCLSAGWFSSQYTPFDDALTVKESPQQF